MASFRWMSIQLRLKRENNALNSGSRWNGIKIKRGYFYELIKNSDASICLLKNARLVGFFGEKIKKLKIII